MGFDTIEINLVHSVHYILPLGLTLPVFLDKKIGPISIDPKTF